MEKLQLSNLLSLYGGMLTEKQRSALTMYCDCDCSLAEIADETGISRQGVRDAIVNGEKTLVRLESTLHFSQFYQQLLVAVDNGNTEQIRNVCLQFVSKE